MGSIKRLFFSLTLLLLPILYFVGTKFTAPTNPTQSTSVWFEKNGKPKVLVTTSIIADLVHHIGGEHVDVNMLIPEDTDPHSYELVKDDDSKLDFADLIIANGLSLEHGSSLHKQLHSRENVIFLGDEVRKRYPDKFIDVNYQIDPHIWMNLKLWSKAIDPVVNNLVLLVPEQADLIRENGVRTREKMLRQDAAIRKAFGSIDPQKRYLVTSHDAFNYFARRYLSEPQERKDNSWKNRVMAIQGLAPDEQISVVEIKEVVEFVNNHNVRVIFSEENLGQDGLKKVVDTCNRKGIPVKLSKKPLYGDTLGHQSLVEMLGYNTKIMTEAFNNGR